MSIRPDWLDERIHLGETPTHSANEARERLANGFETVDAALTESDRQILRELPPARFAAEVSRRAQARSRIDRAQATNRAPKGAAWGTAALAICIALFFVAVPRETPVHVVSETGTKPAPSATHPISNTAPTPNSGSRPEPATVATATPPETGIRTKGEIALSLRQETPEGLRVVTDSDSLVSGTRLRLSVPDSLPWAAVYSIDERGEMAQHWPLQGSHAAPLPQGDLPRVWELDDSPGSETFVLVWSREPFGLDKIRKAVFLNRSKPRLEPGIDARVVRIRKASMAAR